MRLTRAAAFLAFVSLCAYACSSVPEIHFVDDETDSGTVKQDGSTKDGAGEDAGQPCIDFQDPLRFACCNNDRPCINCGLGECPKCSCTSGMCCKLRGAFSCVSDLSKCPAS
jgi:hypothetical protein